MIQPARPTGQPNVAVIGCGYWGANLVRIFFKPEASSLWPTTWPRIGEKSVLGQNVMVGPNVKVGNRCKIQNNVSVYEGVEIDDDVFCGPSAVFTNLLIPRADVDRKAEFVPTRVRRGASIGANATIVCGTELGERCLIGAGAVVTRDVSPHALMIGSPAHQVGWVNHSGARLDDDLRCPETGVRYRLVEGALVVIG